MGVVVNKVLPHKFEKIKQYVSMGFKKKNLPVLGVMPYQKRLDIPTVREIFEELKIRILCGEKHLDNSVDKILIGAMKARDAVKYIVNNSLIITPSDRYDIIRAVIEFQAKKKKKCAIAGLILSGGTKLSRKVVSLLKEHEIPTLLTDTDTYSIASKINDLEVKIKPEDLNKIEIAIKMVQRYVDIDRLIENIS